MSDQDASVLCCACQDGRVHQTGKSSLHGRLKIYRGLPPSHGQEDKLVEISIRLESYYHGCMLCLWRRASAIF
jgi:hypothetical protein